MLKKVDEEYIYFIGADDILENNFIYPDLLENYKKNEYFIPKINVFLKKRIIFKE